MSLFNLTKNEIVIAAILVVALALGLSVAAYQKFSPTPPVGINRFDTAALDRSIASSKIININEADAAELMRLEGVGRAVAERIVAYRAEHGRFASPSRIMDVKGIGEKTFEKIKDRIVTE